VFLPSMKKTRILSGSEESIPLPEDHGLRPWVNGGFGTSPHGGRIQRIGTTGMPVGLQLTEGDDFSQHLKRKTDSDEAPSEPESIRNIENFQ
jgi:hypothetical protein